MRKTLLVAWLLLLPVGGLYHLLAGPEYQAIDAIGDTLQDARQMVAEKKWGAAVKRFEAALQALPEERVAEAQQIRLELAIARMNASQLPDAHAELKALLDEVISDSSHDAAFEKGVREALAQSQFYMTWLMRLEGLPPAEWEPEIESARQNYVMLASKAETQGDTSEANRQKENVEAAIRLARLDLTDLQGLPLPNQ